MVKSKKGIREKQKEPRGIFGNFNLDDILPQKYHVLAVILVIIILFLAFLNPLYFGGKTFESGDIISSYSMQPYLQNHTTGYTLWNPLIFCGMPAYATSTGYKWFNMIYVGISTVRNTFSSLFSVKYTMWSFYLLILAFTSFLLMNYLTKNTLVSLFTALATSFSTGLIVFLFIGHVTKLTSLSIYPLIFLMIIKLREKVKLIDFLILIIAIQLLLQGFHVQIIFYTFFAVGIYYLYYLIRSFVKKQNDLRSGVLKSLGLFAIAAVIALLIQADNITQIYEYTPYSTRGTKSISEKAVSNTNPSSSGYYEYHTMWSFSPEEIATFIVPSFYGFGNSTYQGPLSQGQAVNVNTYFGQMEYVDVAMYMGILVFFLALFAVYSRRKEPLVQFLAILSGLALLISFGKNFPVVFDALFYYLPYFNKFRVPSMILVLVQLSVPMLAGLGIMKIISLRDDKDLKLINLIKTLAFIFTGIFALSVLLNGPVSDWFIARVSDYAAGLQASNSRLAQQFQALSNYIAGIFSSDLIIGFAIMSVAFWAAYAYINAKFSRDTLVLIVIILTLFDLWRIDARGERYVANPDIKKMFSPPSYVTAIKKQDNKNPFRILNIKQDGSLGSINNNSNYNAYFMLEDFYGYSAIKPRAYQDIMDIVGPVNPTLWRMLNVKYIITSQPTSMEGLVPIENSRNEVVYENQEALPRVYFVNSVQKKSAIQTLDLIKSNSFDPKNVAYIQNGNLSVEVPDSTVYAKIKEYRDELVSADVRASGNNFLFFGDTYFPVGWKAYIDGNKTKIYRTNHDFIGILVPKGVHKIEFKYAPKSFYISEYLALILSSIVFLLLIILLLLKLKDSKSRIVETT